MPNLASSFLEENSEKNNTSLFILYSSTHQEGPIYIKAGAEEAYAAFSTIELAELFIKFWRMPESIIIIPAKELGRSYPVFSDITDSAVIFKSYEQLESYFRSPEQYPCSEHVEPLGLS